MTSARRQLIDANTTPLYHDKEDSHIFCVLCAPQLGFILPRFCLCGACDDLSQKTVN